MTKQPQTWRRRALAAMKRLETLIPNLLAQPSLTASARVNKLPAKANTASGTVIHTAEDDATK